PGTRPRQDWRSTARQLVENPNQFGFRSEIDFDPPFLALAHDSDPGAEEQTQALFGRPRVDIDRLRLLFDRLAGFAFDDLPDQRFGFADRQAPGDDVARQPPLIRSFRQRQKRPRG